MQTKLSKLEAKIRELCPELMELTKGCWFTCPHGVNWEVIACDENGVDFKAFALNDTAAVEWHKIKEDGYRNYKILGHPIRLEHVLRAIKNAGRQKNGKFPWYAVQPDGGFIGYDKGTDEPIFIGITWYFDKPWQEQTEVHELLFIILNIE